MLLASSWDCLPYHRLVSHPLPPLTSAGECIPWSGVEICSSHCQSLLWCKWPHPQLCLRPGLCWPRVCSPHWVAPPPPPPLSSGQEREGGREGRGRWYRLLAIYKTCDFLYRWSYKEERGALRREHTPPPQMLSTCIHRPSHRIHKQLMQHCV